MMAMQSVPYQSASGALNTGGATTILAIPGQGLLDGPRALYDAKSLLVIVCNPTSSGQTITSGSVTLTDTLTGLVSPPSITYPLPGKVSIAAGSSQAFVIPLSQGLLPTMSLSVTFGTTPAAGTLQAIVVARGAGEPQVASPDSAPSSKPTITAGAYTAGYSIGGVQSFPAFRVNGGNAVLESVTITDKANQKAAMTLVFFNANPTGANWVDDAAPTALPDVAKVIGQVQIAATDYATVGSDTLAIATKLGIGLELQAASGNSTLYMVAVAVGTPTYASTGDLIFTLGLLQS